MKVQFRTSFTKDLRSIEDKDLLTRISEAITDVENAQSLQDIANLKKLKGKNGYYRLRVGDFRLGLVAVDDEVTFVRCLNRREIYRYFP